MYNFLTIDDFQNWKAEIPTKIESLSKALSDSLVLDKPYNDMAQVLALSEWILEKFNTIDEIEQDTTSWDQLSCAVGEMYRACLDSEWGIELDEDNSENVYFQKPLILIEKQAPICPMFAITMLISRGNPSFLVKSIGKRLRQIESN